MSQVDEDALIAPRVRTMQIVVGALIMGAVSAGAIMAFLRTQGPPRAAPDQPVLTLFVGVPFAVAVILAHLIVPGRVTAAARSMIRRTDTASQTEKLLAVYQTQLLIGAAPLEGAALFMMIAYLLEGYPVSILIAALLVAGIALKLPSVSGIRRWLEEQREQMQKESTMEA
jgi:hypothetical protein